MRIEARTTSWNSSAQLSWAREITKTCDSKQTQWYLSVKLYTGHLQNFQSVLQIFSCWN